MPGAVCLGLRPAGRVKWHRSGRAAPRRRHYRHGPCIGYRIGPRRVAHRQQGQRHADAGKLLGRRAPGRVPSRGLRCRLMAAGFRSVALKFANGLIARTSGQHYPDQAAPPCYSKVGDSHQQLARLYYSSPSTKCGFRPAQINIGAGRSRVSSFTGWGRDVGVTATGRPDGRITLFQATAGHGREQIPPSSGLVRPGPARDKALPFFRHSRRPGPVGLHRSIQWAVSHQSGCRTQLGNGALCRSPLSQAPRGRPAGLGPERGQPPETSQLHLHGPDPTEETSQSSGNN